MAEKELRKMTRTELIEIIYALQQNEKSLRAENETLNDQLQDKVVHIGQAGSIAEAALSLNKVFEDAEKAAQQYLLSVEEANYEKEQILENARQEAEKILSSAQKERDQAAILLKEAMEENRMYEKERKALAEERDKFIKSAAAVLTEYPEIATKMELSSRKSTRDVK